MPTLLTEAPPAQTLLSSLVEIEMDPWLLVSLIVVGLFFTVRFPKLASFVIHYIGKSVHNYTSKDPYEKSIWDSLATSATHFLIFIFFKFIVFLIVPIEMPTAMEKYISQAWKWVVVLVFIEFLYRCKSNFLMGLCEEQLMLFDKLLSLSLLVMGALGVAEAHDLPVHYIMAFGVIGGVATTYIGKDLLSSFLATLYLQFTKPFVIGDYIKVGSIIEGEVIEMGIISTSLVDSRGSSLIVLNSCFFNQVIINESHAEMCVIRMKLRVGIGKEKILIICEKMKDVIKSQPKIFMGKGDPYCYPFQFENTYAEFMMGCNLEKMDKEEISTIKREILLEAARIIEQDDGRVEKIDYE